jgi:hypothetical protein
MSTLFIYTAIAHTCCSGTWCITVALISIKWVTSVHIEYQRSTCACTSNYLIISKYFCLCLLNISVTVTSFFIVAWKNEYIPNKFSSYLKQNNVNVKILKEHMKLRNAAICSLHTFTLTTTFMCKTLFTLHHVTSEGLVIDYHNLNTHWCKNLWYNSSIFLWLGADKTIRSVSLQNNSEQSPLKKSWTLLMLFL